MKPKNFPLRKELRRARAEGREPDMKLRAVRTKKYDKGINRPSSDGADRPHRALAGE